jgi:hypothetical protein
VIRLVPRIGDALVGAPVAELLVTEFLGISMAVEDIGGRLPRPAEGRPVDLDAVRCTALLDFLAAAEPAALLERLDRRLPGEGAAALRARLDTLTAALRAGARADGLRIETD